MTVTSALTHGGLLIGAVVLLYPAVAWLERRSALAVEERERIGRRPLLPLARTLKLLGKRSAPPPGADRPLHLMAPLLGIVVCLFLLAMLPVTAQPPMAVAPGATVLGSIALMLATTWTVAIACAAGNNRMALLGGLRLTALRAGALVAAALGIVAMARQIGSLAFVDVVALQQAPAFAFLPGRGVMAWGAVLSPIGALVSVAAFSVVSQRMSPTRPDLALDLVDSYAAASAGPVLLAHRVFEIVELLAHAGLLATVAFGGFSPPFSIASEWSVTVQVLVEVATFVVKTLIGCGVIITVRRLIPPLTMAQATRLSWLLLVPLGAFAVLVPRDFFVRFLS